MLPKVALGRHCCAQSTSPDNFRPLVDDEMVDEIQQLARSLAGVRICQINATAAGGGVAELLASQIPAFQAMGIKIEWRLIHGDGAFFEVTKAFHNALQGGKLELGGRCRETYLAQNKICAGMIDEDYDVFIIHDPQPVALRRFADSRGGKWIWRCHIDSSEPNPEVWGFLKSFVEEYDAAVFTMKEFRPPNLEIARRWS